MPQQQDPDILSPTRMRPRAPTFSSNPFVRWRQTGKQLAEPVSTPGLPPPSSSDAMSVEELIQELTPPHVMSLPHARALSEILPSHTPIPGPKLLNPVLAALCAAESSIQSQTAGFDILAAYWKNRMSSSLSAADRWVHFGLIKLPVTSDWSMELAGARLRALTALTQEELSTTGMENEIVALVESWIDCTFEGAICESLHDRERHLAALGAFLKQLYSRPAFAARLTPQDVGATLAFYERLVDRALAAPPSASSASSPPPDGLPSTSSTPVRPQFVHRRHPSSTSLLAASLSSPAPLPQSAPPRKPLDLALPLYLDQLVPRLQTPATLPLDAVLPVLFRALAEYASPLPMLSSTSSQSPLPLERQIQDCLDKMARGKYSARFFRVLKQHLRPPPGLLELPLADQHRAIQITVGAFRTIRMRVRSSLLRRLDRMYILRGSSYYSDGLESSVAEEDGPFSWDPTEFGSTICRAARAWIALEGVDILTKDPILDEAAGIVKDSFEEVEQRSEEIDLDEEEGRTLAKIIETLVPAVVQMRDMEGNPICVPISHPFGAPTPFLRTLSSILARYDTISLTPPLYMLMLPLIPNLSDAAASRIPRLLDGHGLLAPVALDWLTNWDGLFTNDALHGPARPQAHTEVMRALRDVYAAVKDIPVYRRPLADRVLEFWQRHLTSEREDSDEDKIVWEILGDEVVWRTVEGQEYAGEEDTDMPAGCEEIMQLLTTTALEAVSRSSEAPTPMLSTTSSSPTLSRSPTEMQASQSISFMLHMTRFVSGSTPVTPAPVQPAAEEPILPPPPPTPLPPPQAVRAVTALVSVFSQLAFTPYALWEDNLKTAIRVFRILLNVLVGGCTTARLTALQFLMRIRADRDHHLYYVYQRYDKDGHIRTLASLVRRCPKDDADASSAVVKDEPDLRQARPRMVGREGRRPSRGRGARPTSVSTGSRSRSRASTNPTIVTPKPKEPLWQYPEYPPFSIRDMDTPSERLISYDPEGPGHRIVLPISEYLDVLRTILDREADWEVLSYVLCHLPTQLSNKHLFCGPKSRGVVEQLLTALVNSVADRSFAVNVDFPSNLKSGDAQGLAYHVLSVLIGYRRCFSIKQQHLMIEVFQAGLTMTGQLSTIKCCLHALSMSAFELPSSTTRYLTDILRKLSQIMSNPEMAVHIINFLCIIGSLPALHSNFNDDDYRLVFGVALQYLQNHNPKPDSELHISWALAQHLRIMSYYVLYLWFLNVSLPDRPTHVRYITRQLLLANEGNSEVDAATEIAFDWLARYTYASADPRPASSVLDEMVMKPTGSDSAEDLPQKSWLLGYSIVTVRALPKRGWMQVEACRPSGLTKFICRTENVPMVGPGEVDPDMTSLPALLMMDRDLRTPLAPVPPTFGEDDDGESTPQAEQPREIPSELLAEDDVTEEQPPRPDSVTGYVWSGTAPSQRRKEVAIDPAFFALQLSSYPEIYGVQRGSIIRDQDSLKRLLRSLERMPVIDTHKVGIMYVAPGQTDEVEILRNTHGSPAYTRFLEGLGRLINLRGQKDVYAGNLDPDVHGEYAYAWWDDTGQILFHTATLMPTTDDDPRCNEKKAHIGNDNIRIVWNDSGNQYKFDTLQTQFQFVNIVIEPHSYGPIAAFSNNLHENEYFKLTVQRHEGMTEFSPVGDFKLISAEALPLMVRQICLLGDWFANVFKDTSYDTERVEIPTNWRSRLDAIKRFRAQLPTATQTPPAPDEGLMAEEVYRDFTAFY